MECSKATLVLGLKDWVSECPFTDRFPLALCLAQCLRQLLSDAIPPVGEEQLDFFTHCVGSCWRLAEELKPGASPTAACLSEWDWIQSLQDTDLEDPDSPLSPGGRMAEEEGPIGLVVQMHGALDVPKVDRIGHADTLAEVWVERQCERITAVQRTQVCWSHANPVWKAFLEFRGEVSEKDVLHVKLKNVNLHRETTIGTGYTPVMALPSDEPLELDIISDRQSRCPCTVVLQRALAPSPPTKTIFLLRHAQSKWNAAQASHAFHQMAQYDHPINATGLAQARQFRDQWLSSAPSPLQETFMEAELIFCSPLTRAIQTCVLALQGHPTICSRGVRLLQSAREIKKMGGLDTVGKATGDRIVDRVREELAKLLPPEEVELLIPQIDPYNTVSNWWKSVVGCDTQKAVSRRLESFMSTLKYTPAHSLIVVGHSLFFQGLLRQYLAPEYQQASSKWCEEITSLKLDNVSCMALTVDFSAPTARITHAELMFGTRLHSEKAKRFRSADSPSS
eukprot:GGOE01044590.1.p1 GENE.GGOE01044590.1~~GGOE01044590.1.p1  ORF type:complete len:508 (-),score=143.33 GGOE01044590.1:308-1831(-)